MVHAPKGGVVMAVSVVEICNNALQDLGEKTIINLNDDNKRGRLCNQRWPAVRDATIRSHEWNSCMDQAELAADSVPPAFRWDFRYKLPSDFVRLSEIVGSDETEIKQFEVQNGYIMTDEQAPIYISYVKRELDPQKYDPLLSEALSAHMAAVLAYPLTASTSLSEARWTIYVNKIQDARGVDAREGVPDDIAMTSWLQAKLGGRSQLGVEADIS
jgi:hypothetical protein